jgi:hypothetical protein
MRLLGVVFLLQVILLFCANVIALASGKQSSTDQSLPLISVEVLGELIDYVGRLQIIQRYKNNYESDLNGKFYLDLGASSTLIGMSIVSGEQKLTGIIKHKEGVYQDDNKPITTSKRNKLETVDNDLYSIDVGHIAAAQEIQIEVIFLTKLESFNDGRIKFSLPTSIGFLHSEEKEKRENETTFTLYSLDRLSPPPSSPFSFLFNMTWLSQQKIQEVGSPTDKISVLFSSPERVQILSSNIITSSRGDFAVTMKTAQQKTKEPSLYVTKEKEYTYLMINHLLKAEADYDTDFNKEREYLFLVDLSNSAPENSNTLKTQVLTDDDFMKSRLSRRKVDTALELFLLALPTTRRFNVISYGEKGNNEYETMFPHSVKNTENNQKITMERMETIGIDSETHDEGDLLTVLSEVLSREKNVTHSTNSNNNNKETVLILITQGKTGKHNSDAMLSLVRSASFPFSHHRIFTLGIGKDVNRVFLTELSRISNGYNAFWMGNQPHLLPSITIMIMESLEKQYDLTTRLRFDDFNERIDHKRIYSGQELTTSFYYQILTAVWERTSLLKWTGYNGESASTVINISWVFDLTDYRRNEGKQSFLNQRQQQPMNKLFIRQLWAIDQIQNFEEYNSDSSLRGFFFPEQIVKFSVQHQVMNERTEFILTDKKIDLNQLLAYKDCRIKLEDIINSAWKKQPEEDDDVIVVHSSERLKTRTTDNLGRKAFSVWPLLEHFVVGVIMILIVFSLPYLYLWWKGQPIFFFDAFDCAERNQRKSRKKSFHSSV